MKKLTFLMVYAVVILFSASQVFAVVLNMGGFQNSLSNNIKAQLSDQQQQDNFDKWYEGALDVGAEGQIESVNEAIENSYNSASGLLARCIEEGILPKEADEAKAVTAVDNFIASNPGQLWSSLVAAVQKSIDAVKSANENLGQIDTQVAAEATARDMAL